MDARDATANNADLWTHYLRQQWRQFVDPFGLGPAAITDATGRMLAEVTAANVSSVLSMWMGPVVTRMFERNAPAVSQMLTRAAVEDVQIPPAFAARPKAERTDMTQREEWASTSAREAVAAY